MNTATNSNSEISRKTERGIRLLMLYVAGFLLPYWSTLLYQCYQNFTN